MFRSMISSIFNKNIYNVPNSQKLRIFEFLFPSKLQLTQATLLNSSYPKQNFDFHFNSSYSSVPEASKLNRTEKPRLVVLFAWLYSPERHLAKYRQLYLQAENIDVFTVRVTLLDFLMPRIGCHRIARKTVQFLLENSNRYDSCLFHSFSVGTYQIGEVFRVLTREAQKRHQIEPILKGIILDSPTNVSAPENTARALMLASTNNRTLQSLLYPVFYSYLLLFRPISFSHYVEGFKAVDDNPLRLPILMFASKDDIIGNYGHFERNVIDHWKQDGVEVRVKCWDRSIHVSHYLMHPEEYRTSWSEFVWEKLKI